ncbi:hypothetical protein [Limisphaera sp. 4302-co]|uniref:hypothetical protein n=1 Tax=Limisphaera sp. 4302-co TaxID=3400417 RepID=UPI003C1D674D
MEIVVAGVELGPAVGLDVGDDGAGNRVAGLRGDDEDDAGRAPVKQAGTERLW